MEIIFMICITFVIVIAVFTCLFIAKKQSKHYFKCKHCGKMFQPKWTQMLFEIHSLNEHNIECPYCKVMDFCEDKGK